MEREYFEVETPVEKVKVKLKKWLTGGEKMTMMNLKQEEQMEWMLKTIVTEPGVEVLKNLHGKDFDFLLLEMNKVADESSLRDKKKQ